MSFDTTTRLERRPIDAGPSSGGHPPGVALSDPQAPRRIPMAQPSIGALERELVDDVLSSGILALGPYAVRFEDEIARLAGRRFGIACSSGTAGLHMAVRALGIGQGDEVITTPFSFIASASCIIHEGARPRFVDIEEETLGLDPDLVTEAGGRRVKGILPVHVFGRPCRIAELAELARSRSWVLIEDACEALGSRRASRPMGSFGEASVFAFYPNKQITTGEGGVVVTDDPETAVVLRSLRNQGRDEDGTWLRHIRLGFNYRLDELSAAIGVAQLERLEELRAGRRRVVAAYESLLGAYDWLRLPRHEPDEEVDWFVYVIRLASEIDRSQIIEDLEAMGVPSRPYFSPLHLQPAFAELGYHPGDFPVTERVAKSTLALPFSALRTDDDAEYVAGALIDAVARRSHAPRSIPGSRLSIPEDPEGSDV